MADMTVEEFLAGVESRLTAREGGMFAQYQRHAPSDLAKLTTALRAVLALHVQGRDRRGNWCTYDGDHWPCRSVAAITDALGDTP